MEYLNTSVPEVLHLSSTRIVKKRTIVIKHKVYTIEEATMEIQDLYLQQPKSVKLRAHVPSCSTGRDNDTSSLLHFVLTLQYKCHVL